MMSSQGYYFATPAAASLPVPQYYRAFCERQAALAAYAPSSSSSSSSPSSSSPSSSSSSSSSSLLPDSASIAAALSTIDSLSSHAHPSTKPSASQVPTGVDASAHAAYVAQYELWYATHVQPVLLRARAVLLAAQQPMPSNFPVALAPELQRATSPPSASSSSSSSSPLIDLTSPSPAPHEVNRTVSDAAAPSLSHSFSRADTRSAAPDAASPANYAHSSSSSAFDSSSLRDDPASSSPSSSHSERKSRWSQPAAAASSSPSPSLPDAAAAAPAIDSAWSPALVEYVSRSLEVCPPALKPEVEAWLRQRIERAVGSGDIHRIRWDGEPLAHRVVQSLKAEGARSSSSSSSSHSGSSHFTLSDSNSNHSSSFNHHSPSSFDSHSSSSYNHNSNSNSRFSSSSSSHHDRHLDDKGNQKSRGSRVEHAHDGERDSQLTHSSSLNRKRWREEEEHAEKEDNFVPLSSSSSSSSSSRKANRSSSSFSFAADEVNSSRATLKDKGGRKSKQQQNGQQPQHAPPAPAPKKPPSISLDGFDLQRNEQRSSRFADFLKNEASLPTKQQVRTDLFMLSSERDETAGEGEGEDARFALVGVVGSSEALEKDYYRLTSAPDPASVRPEPALKRSLAHCIERWNKERNYEYACNQLKSIRQDLTVQHLRNAFAVQVYETHARIALEVGDSSEFAQCQTQLIGTYHDDPTARANEDEFIVYRILFAMATGTKQSAASVINALEPRKRAAPEVAIALSIRQAFSMGEFYQFLKLARHAPFMSAKLLHPVVARERFTALQMLVRSFKPTKVETAFFMRSLAFDDSIETVEFLSSHGAMLSEDQQLVVTSASELHEIESKPVEEESKGVMHALFARN